MELDDYIKLSVPETGGRSLHHSSSPEEFVLCPEEEPPESIKSFEDGLQTFKPEPICFLLTDEFSLYPEESPESSRSDDGVEGMGKLKFGASIIFRLPMISAELCNPFHELYLSTKLLLEISCLTLSQLNFGQYDKPPERTPESKPFSISQYGALKKKPLTFRDSLFASYLSSSLIIKIMLTSLFQSVASETQSLMYYHTGIFQENEYPFKFAASGFVNGQQIDKYDHNLKCNVPVASWMATYNDEAYWERETNYRRGWEKVFRDNINILKHRINDSSIFLTLQLMYGCNRNSDGRVRGHYQYALNGRDFLYLDENSLLWQPGMFEAQISADRWNTDSVIASSVKDYFTQHCNNALEKYISLGEQELKKKVLPEVKVWGHQQSDDVSRLRCLVYGFYPQAVDVKWMRNGRHHVPSYETTPILPHPDGTYQITVSVEVPTRERDTYSCHVEHSSLGTETLSVIWEPMRHRLRLRIFVLTTSMILIIIFFLALVLAKYTYGRKSSIFVTGFSLKSI